MKNTAKKTVVVALGGSVMYPDAINYEFLKKFRQFILRRLENNRFIIVVGGGRICRVYQEAAAKITRVADEDKDWLGIHTTRTNAHLLRTIFQEVADPIVIDERYKIKQLKYPVTIASGWRPGWSTDYVAVALASDFQIPEVIVAGKPAYVYNKDFSLYSDAFPIKTITWKKYRAMIPTRWKPGAHAPVDPIAASLAHKEGITAFIIQGTDLKNFSNLLAGVGFVGTTISSRP